MSEVIDESDVLAQRTGDGSQFLTFKLNDEEFGVEILRVQEIKGLSRITPVPNMPGYVRGMMNLRGTVVPILDLRSKLSLPTIEYNQFAVIIVVTINDKITGLLVDGVNDVLNVANSDIEDTPSICAEFDATCVNGIAKVGERLITLLDLNRLIPRQQTDLQIPA
ncbi:chemotaxis protein CheW [Stieleria sp. JC731]|uniref:chemotaxis protein CheW n=1 Tax=Pirellulaceae TaxID=2691357 RepID=UPI001E525C71|nr:chemotaxis protein CheW [Stieleria sp. JC731]MCC9603423.1 chemotaxis protein CheW [Stieleria sp. JC731]